LVKIRNLAAFKKTIYRLGLPSGLVPAVAWLNILYETILGGLFFWGVFPLFASIAALLLLLVFIGVSIIVMVRHQKIACNCFGQSESPLGYETLIRAMVLIVPVIVYYLSSLTARSTWWPTTIDLALSLLSLVIGIILLTRWLLEGKSILTLARNSRIGNKGGMLS